MRENNVAAQMLTICPTLDPSLDGKYFTWTSAYEIPDGNPQSTYSARSRFRPSFFPNEHGTRADEVPSLGTRQPPGDQRQRPLRDGPKDNVAIAGVPDANVGQCRSLRHIHGFWVWGVEGEEAIRGRFYIGIRVVRYRR
jgi:hypothetical protein